MNELEFVRFMIFERIVKTCVKMRVGICVKIHVKICVKISVENSVLK